METTNDPVLTKAERLREEVMQPNGTSQYLKDALENSELILAHATEAGLEIPPAIIETIVEAKHLESIQKWTKEAEIAFWLSYKSISKQIRPVTINSLLATKERKIINPNWYNRILSRKVRKSLTHGTVIRYTAFTLITMIVMLSIQVYQIIGTAQLNTILTIDEKINANAEKIAQLDLMISANGANQSAALQQEQLVEETFELQKQKNSSIKLVQEWLNFSKLSTTLSATFATKAAETQEIQNPVLSPELVDRNIKTLQSAQNITMILGLYILPLLYGLLGGFVFVLRTLSQEIRNLTFSKDSTIKFTLRIHLGALAGMAVGLFWGDIESQKVGIVDSLSTILISFIAGYSVEYLFTVVDKIVGQIIGQKENRKEDNIEPARG